MFKKKKVSGPIGVPKCLYLGKVGLSTVGRLPMGRSADRALALPVERSTII